ncbi:MAG: phosphoribosylaminoimidazolesuccinocarboxamide synthase [Candidatus Dadabacteria bacterium]|nr:MAG: phosphoribosylaminoimidazolesuccinocarboxamide synthase [Candidatus Dadabacteria bacterium]
MVGVEKREQIAEGKAKKIFATSDPKLLIFYFKDDATAFNAQKRGTIASKGRLNRAISARLFRLLEERGVPTHFVEEIGEREMLVRRLDIIPVETVVRNVVAGSLQKRTGRPEGEELPRPIVEYYYKSDELGDPMINEDHATVFGWAEASELEEIRRLALAVNDILKSFFADRGIILVDFKLEFGRDAEGRIILGDEICPDTCRLWDASTRRKLDKDRFRQDLGEVEEAYQEIARRVAGE